ncbi:thiamine pyrophosphate-binding protein [Herbaspirillum sp. WKF16]|uniref:thiamine pyrophosphate-binding protein n=1 Tax=Herbaspirillum sp. WKF16 TaxID=3028312 RepID=UPI0023AA0944|nr:thiamine pyrophosphate-binding protein [Herbaspirillum sp. WKF16]WDZ94303.1 thiamine pyrophosphate-binding protein [Herbaspirillum sp. WKF16]
MKLSDYVIDYLHLQGTKHVFGMSGGAAVHLFDSASRHPEVQPVFMAHEQSAAIAADGYYRVSGQVGACVVTSGPGATNLLTGVCCSYYDSVPTLMLTGQVATNRLKGARQVRQVGFQETDTLSIYSSVTKSAQQIADPKEIGTALEHAYLAARGGRPGPVLIDIPDDLQRADVEAAVGSEVVEAAHTLPSLLLQQVKTLLQQISSARRPVIVVGGGFSTPRRTEELRAFLRDIEVPVVQTWAGLDLLPSDWTNRIGTFGVYGSRLGNFVVQNADLLICLGTRLSQNLTGGALKDFAPSARIVMVDIDRGEMDKFDGYGIEISERIHASMEEFLRAAVSVASDFVPPDISAWLSKIAHWRRELPEDVLPEPAAGSGFVDANHFVRALSDALADDEIIFVDTGGNLTWTCNNLRVKARQRLLSAWNFTPMGYAVPAAIGGAFAAPGSPITCIIGDGGLQLCLGELATVVRHGLPIKIILFNNHSHGIQKQTLETWLEGHYAGVDPNSGLGLSDFRAVAAAMGLPVITIDDSAHITRRLDEVYRRPGPVFCNVEIRIDQKLYPVLKSGAPLDDQMPLMPREKLVALRSFEN